MFDVNPLSVSQNKVAQARIKLMDIATKIKNREKRWNQLKKRISEITVSILQKDILSEESFDKATEFEFDFAKNRFLVDGRTKFSASSICYLKSAFFFALLLSSIEDDKVFYPRFLLLDNIEDKGSIPERVRNMHNIIIQLLKDIKEDHQVIFTTSVLDKSLNDSKYCVGPEYNFNRKTLNFTK